MWLVLVHLNWQTFWKGLKWLCPVTKSTGICAISLKSIQDVFGDVIWQILIDTYLLLWWEKPVKATHKSTVTLVLALNATRSCWERVVTRPTLPIVYQVEKLFVITQTVAHLSCPRCWQHLVHTECWPTISLRTYRQLFFTLLLELIYISQFG